MPALFISHLKALVRTSRAYVRTFLTPFPHTDYERWSDLRSFNPDWDSRTMLIAEMIDDGANVIEFGSGRLALKEILGKRCNLTATDLIKRSDDTLVIDLNADIPKLDTYYDVAVFSGVLEYIRDLDRLMIWLNTISDSVIFSYAPTDFLSDPVTRRKNGWVNHLSCSDLDYRMSKWGLSVEQVKQWDGQLIFSCRFAPH